MNYTSKTYDDTNKGVLYANNEKGKDKWIITNQGKLNIDGQEDRIIAVRRKNKDGQYILELYKAMGTLKENENKNGDNDPDAKGIVNKLANEDSLSISAWKKVSKEDNPYINLAVRHFDNIKTVQEQKADLPNDQAEKDLDQIDDPIPF